ncbi:MAG TPA: ABC transporter ATP-binding protein [Candidatus Saccharimonadales bacterium]
MKSILYIDHLVVKRSTEFSLKIDELRLPPGKVLCVTGQNGSGKSTFLESISGVLKPNSGLVSIAGRPLSRNLRQAKANIGYIPDDEEWIIRELCAREYFDLLAKIYDKIRTPVDIRQNTVRLANALQFTSFKQQLGQLSHGNKKKVQLIAGLMHEPKLIIIDELRNGLDPLAIKAAEKLVANEANRGAAVVVATHDLWWAERNANEIIILDQGCPQVQDTAGNLVKQHGSLEALFIKNMEATHGTAAL